VSARRSATAILKRDSRVAKPEEACVNVDNLPTAKDVIQRLDAARAAEASKQSQRAAKAAAEKKALIDHLNAPSQISDEEAIRRALVIIERAVKNGLTEVQVYRFPHELCTDNGRAINQQEAGWEQTLSGVPKEIFQLWDKYFRPRGYKLRAEIVSYPEGMPGDVGITLAWR
jgi:disulfide oxidoreductase YuzD